MKRPLMAVGFAYLSALFAASLFPYQSALWLLAGTAVSFLISLVIPSLRRRKILPVLLLTASAALLSYAGGYWFSVEPAARLDGERAQVTAQVISLPEYRQGKYYYLLKTSGIEMDNAPQQLKLRLCVPDELDVEPYDTIRTEIRFFTFGGEVNSSSARYYASSGILLGGYGYEEVHILPAESRPPGYWLLRLRETLSSRIDHFLGGQPGGVVKGILLGDNSGISRENRQNFRDAGVSHLFAVSGMHMAVIGSCVFLLLTRLRLSRQLAALLAMAAVFIFMGVTGFSPSVNRAGIMSMVYYLGLVLSKRADPLNSLGISILGMTLTQPLMVQHVGFLLSVTATLGILVVHPPMMRWFDGKIGWSSGKKKLWLRTLHSLVSLLALTLAASLTTLPVLVYAFGSIPLMGLLSNLLMVNVSSLLLICAGIAALCGGVLWLNAVTYPLFFVAGQLARYLIWCGEWLSRFPYPILYLDSPYVALWFGLLFVTAVVVALVRKRVTLWALTCLMLVTLFASFSFQFAVNYNTLQIRVLDVKDGLCVLVRENDRAMVVGGNLEYDTLQRLEELLERSGVTRLEALVLPTLTASERKDGEELLKTFAVRNLIVPRQVVLLEQGDMTLSVVERANCLLWEDVTMDIDLSGKNALVALRAGNQRILICASPQSEANALEEKYGGFDIVVARQDFCPLEQTPSFACLSAGQLQNGVYTTCQQGEILIKTDGKQYRVVRG